MKKEDQRVLVVAGVVINQNNKYLLIQEKSYKYMVFGISLLDMST
ncbi:MAG: hypothetical protein WC841_03480 [Candidatus Shapirobacteria bacterium]|jgi:hypothetical protein